MLWQLMSNTTASSSRSKWLPRNGRLNRFILWQEGAVQQWKTISITSSKGLASIQAGKRDKILASHVQRICEANDTMIQSYYQQIYGSSGADR